MSQPTLASAAPFTAAVLNLQRDTMVDMANQPRSTCRRIIARTMLFLLLISSGAIINIAVAWTCRYERSAPTQSSKSFTGWLFGLREANEAERACIDRAGIKPAVMNDECLEDIFVVSPSTGYGWNTGSVFETERLRANCPQETTALFVYLPTACFFDAGWPLRSLSGEEYLREPAKRDALICLRYSNGQESVSLPFRPIWPGFAINTVLYAALLWPLFAIPGALRRRRRIKRGLCPACAYPMGESPVCTECGKPTHQNRAREQAADGRRT